MKAPHALTVLVGSEICLLPLCSRSTFRHHIRKAASDNLLLPYDFFMTDVLEKQTEKTAEEQPCQLQPGPFFTNIGQGSQNA